MKVFIERDNKTIECSANECGTIQSLLDKLELNPSTVLVTKNGTLAPESTDLLEDDSLKIHSVISGG